MMQSMYDTEAVRPMWEELAQVGIQPLTTAAEVDALLGKKEGTVLLVVNSVCGCAAGGARPGAMLALQHNKIPDGLGTVFAGVDREATQRAREFLAPLPPSSPFIALFKNGELVFALQRHNIEQMNAGMIAQALTEAFDQHCSAPGPSVPPEVFNKLVPVQMCGSSIPRT